MIFEIKKSPVSKREELQSPTAPENVVHCVIEKDSLVVPLKTKLENVMLFVPGNCQFKKVKGGDRPVEAYQDLPPRPPPPPLGGYPTF